MSSHVPTPHDPAAGFVPLPLPVEQRRQHRPLRRHPVRIVAIAFAFLAAAGATVALLRWLIPDPTPSPALVLSAFLCPIALALTGIWLMSSVRSGYRISQVALAVAVGVTALWWYAGDLASMRERIGFAVAIVGPAVVMLLLSRYLMSLRRSQIVRPIL
ncbi:MAG: hypothetical protein ACTHQE_09170 [Thermomicrobiales bacterium]